MPRRPSATLLLVLLLLLPSCRVTFRQPEIKPLNPVRTYAVAAPDVCDAVLEALGGLQLEIAESSVEEDACLIETDYRRLADDGSRIETLRDVAYVTGAEYFGHGRYLVTATVRTVRDAARVRLTTRIEGFDAGYRVVRSTGVIEEALFERISEAAGAQPVDESGGR